MFYWPDCICVPRAGLVAMEARRRLDLLELGTHTVVGCHVVVERNLGPPQKQWVLLTVEPSLWSRVHFKSLYFFCMELFEFRIYFPISSLQILSPIQQVVSSHC